MTVVSTIPGTPDPTLPDLIPELGITLNHSYFPGGFSSTGWTDSTGDLDLGAVGAGTIQRFTDNGQDIAYFDGTVRAESAFPAFVEGDVQTVIIVARPNDADIATSPYMFNGGSVGISQGGSSGAPAAVRNGNNPTLLPASVRNKWHMYAISTPIGSAGSFVLDNLSTALLGTSGGTSISVAGSPTGFRQLRVAAVLTSQEAISAATLTGTVYPRLKSWFALLPWG